MAELEQLEQFNGGFISKLRFGPTIVSFNLSGALDILNNSSKSALNPKVTFSKVKLYEAYLLSSRKKLREISMNLNRLNAELLGLGKDWLLLDTHANPKNPTPEEFTEYGNISQIQVSAKKLWAELSKNKDIARCKSIFLAACHGLNFAEELEKASGKKVVAGDGMLFIETMSDKRSQIKQVKLSIVRPEYYDAFRYINDMSSKSFSHSDFKKAFRDGTVDTSGIPKEKLDGLIEAALQSYIWQGPLDYPDAYGNLYQVTSGNKPQILGPEEFPNLIRKNNCSPFRLEQKSSLRLMFRRCLPRSRIKKLSKHSGPPASEKSLREGFFPNL